MAPAFVFLWLGIAAGVTGLVLLALPSTSIEIQMLIFAVFSVASVDQPAARRKAAAGTADRHLGTVDYLLSTIVQARQTRLVATIEAYQLLVSDARRSLNGLEQATRNAAPAD